MRREPNFHSPPSDVQPRARCLTGDLTVGADEGTLGRILVKVAVLQSAHSPTESAKALHDVAEFYKVDVAAITAKVKQEFAAKKKTAAA